MHTIILSPTTAQIGCFINHAAGGEAGIGGRQTVGHTGHSMLGGDGGWGSSPRGRLKVERSYSTIMCVGRTG